LNYQTRLLPFAAPLVTLVRAACWFDARTDVAELLLIARNPERLQELQSALGRGKIGLKKRCPGRYVVWVASMPKGIEIDPAVLKQPCLLLMGLS